MEKTEVKKIEVEEVTHSYYCDDCGKLLLSSVEHDDCYHAEPPRFYLSSGICLEGHYCNDCGMKRIRDALSYLKSNNFSVPMKEDSDESN